MRKAAKNQPPQLRRPGQHNWIHGLPLKMRFKKSKIYLSVIPVATLGFSIGVLTSVMGVGGGFIMMLAAFIGYVAALAVLVPAFGNHGLWAGLNLFLLMRGAFLLMMIPRRAAQTFRPIQ